MPKALMPSLLRTLIQILLLLGISKAFEANATLLEKRCNSCQYVAQLFGYSSTAFFLLAVLVILLVVTMAKGTLDESLAEEEHPEGVKNKLLEFYGRANEIASVAFFWLLAVAVVLTDGILESALAGLLTVSLIYSVTRAKPTGSSVRFRALELITVAIVVVWGEFALAYYFGQKAGYREAASIFDGSFPTKMIGYSTFSMAFLVIVAENWSSIRATFHDSE